MKTCCEKNGYPMGCNQGRKCPDTESQGAILAFGIILVFSIIASGCWMFLTMG